MIKCPNCSFDNLDGSAYCDSCGDPLGAATPVFTHPVASASSGRVIAGRYRIERELGGGGQKLMYLAADLRLSDRLCALAELTPSARSQQAIAEGKLMFGREAQILATLSNIHIVQVYDYFDEANRCYLVEEYVRGQTLQQRIASRGRLGIGEIVEIALQVLDALEYLHGQTPPLVHRDLKPDNIMLAPATGGAEVVKLIDFGIARHFQVQRGTVHGTPGYAAPEQYRGMAEPRTDLYALGGILHYALSGRDPQQNEPFSFPPLESLRPDLPKPLCTLIDQALSNEADHRPSSAAEFKARLIAGASAKPGASHAPRSPASRPRTRAPAHHPAPPQPHSTPPPPPMAPTVPLPAAAPPPHSTPGPPQAAVGSRIEWSPAQVVFQAVQRGGGVAPVTLTVRNTGRGTLEARVETDRPDLVRVTPNRITENQAQLRVEIDSSAVMWGHRYRANVYVVLDHSGDTIAIPVVVEAADNQTVLARVRALSRTAIAVAGAIALAGEIPLASMGITIAGILQGATSTNVREAANFITTLGLLAMLIMLAASRRRGRVSTVIFGLIAISAVHAALAGLLIDYLLFPALAVGIAIGNSLMLRRVCIRLLSRRGLGLGARARAFFLLLAPPTAVCAAALLMASTVPAPPPLSAYRWTPPQPPPHASAGIGPKPYVAARPVARYRATARPRRTARPPELIEAELRQNLAAGGFPNVGVSVDSAGHAYISGSASDFTQKQEIENLARGAAGVRGVVSTLEVPKGWMGLTVKSGGGGALVSYLAPGGPADRAGIMLDDVIVAIDRRTVWNHADFRDAIAVKAAGQTVTVALVRGGQTINLAVKLGSKPSHSG